MSDSQNFLHLAVALDGAGWHPAAWREPDARPLDLFTPRYWVDQVQQAERGLIDFVTIEDSLRLQSDDPFQPDARTDRVRGRLDATLIAARVAPVTSHIGLVPTAIVTHTEPFHLSKAIATIDYASAGRAGIRVQLDARADANAHFGRREIQPLRREDYANINTPELQQRLRESFDEAAAYVEVLRRLWDSWEDGAEIRDVATGRFVDRDKLHYIDFEGRFFSVKGPSITPRPPQGQPLVTASDPGLGADLVFASAPEPASDALTLVDLVVFLGANETLARARKDGLDEIAAAEYDGLPVFVGTPSGLADLLLAWRSRGIAGARLHPAVLPDDLVAITQGLVPELQHRGVFHTAYTRPTLRERFGLPLPASRYATGASA